MNKDKIAEIIAQRNIKYLVHFTIKENVESIEKNGLLSRKMLEQQNIDFHHTDNYRHDGLIDYISTSITAPNYPMLKKKMKEQPEKAWFFCFIKAKAIIDLDCKFFVHNAATNKGKTETPDFNELFNRKRGNRNELPPSLPSFIQAEIMFKEKIPLVYLYPDLIEVCTNKYGNIALYLFAKAYNNRLPNDDDSQEIKSLFSFWKNNEFLQNKSDYIKG